ncbi:ATP-binding protein [Streptomyces sp. NPDC020766]|uniref:ATP-binding protein n=1 Tax=Streptomyces sp. NPDC020766 TaxID=3155011 RepID=UPI0033C4AAB7
MTRREVNSARVWLSKAKEPQLVSLAMCALGWTSRALREEYGFPEEVVAAPSVDQLLVMLEVLEPPLARCVLYGLISPDAHEVPAAALAVAHQARLSVAADREPPPNAREVGGTYASGADEDESGSEGTEGTAMTMAAKDESGTGVAARERSLTSDDVVTELRRAGTDLADRLREAADAVFAGYGTEGLRLREDLDAWAELRARTATLLAGEGGTWPVDAGYEELTAELGRIREERDAELGLLREKVTRYEGLVAEAGDEVEAAALRSALERVRLRIAQLVRDSPEAVGAPPEAPEAPEDDECPDSAPAEAVGATTFGADEEAGEEAEETGTTTADAPEPADAEPVESAEVEDPAGAAGAVQTGELAQPAVVVEPTATPPAVPGYEPAEPPEAAAVKETGKAQGAQDTEDASEPPPARTALGPTGTTSSAAPPSVAPAPEGDEPWRVGAHGLEWDARAPWDSGASSPVAQLVRTGHLAEAYWMTSASDESEWRCQALGFATGAFGCAGEAEATQIQIAYDVEPQDLAQDREAHLVALVAALRTGLTDRWPHALVSDFTMPSGLSAPWQELLTVLVTAVRDCRTFEPGAVEADAGAEARLTPQDIGEAARVLLEDLPRRKIQYQRASRVLQYLCGSAGELGNALRALVHWANGEGDARAFQELGETLRRKDHIDRLIEESDSRFRTPKQAKEPIHSGALRQLHAAAKSVGELLAKADAVATGLARRDGEAEADIPQLSTVLREVKAYEAPTGVGGAALGLLRSWLSGTIRVRAGADVVTSADDPTRPSADCLLVLPDLPRDADGDVDIEDQRTARRMAPLLAPPAPEEALQRYLERGDLHLARALVRRVERDPDDSGTVDAEWCEQASRRRREAEKTWRRKVADRHREAAGLLAQIRTLNLMPPDTEREFTGRLQQFADGDEGGRYRYAIASLAALVGELAELVGESTSRLREDLDRLRLDPDSPLDEADHDRILRLINEGDTVTAQEFLALVGGGGKLPDRPVDDDAELAQFVAGLTGPGTPTPGGEGVHAAWWAQRYSSGKQFTPAAELGLESWKALCTKRGRNSEWQQHLPRVLRLLGLEPTGSLNPERPEQGARRLKVRASVAEGAGYVAALGSRATSYTILLIWEEQRADGPLAHLEDADVDANIVLYLHPLGLEGRRGLAESARTRAQQALVVDPAVFGWMAARAPGAFRALQRVTLPWTSYNPYTPFVAGLVPAEVFYGRDEEMREVMDQAGGLFLYGGRQLGKSALLRRVAELFPSRSESNIAVYLDLLKAEIGQAESPEQIWQLLAEDLKRRNVIDPKRVSAGAGPDIVVKHIRTWLDEDDSRRLLILADEADAFLTADSRRVFRAGGESTFPNVKRFQQLMEQTDRRLKVVFAGLHQVQRFGELSNVSTAHGGPDVLVGPLNQHAAVRLVTEPMAALGYLFDRPQLVWRILAITNYQANLVQIFCSELVRTLQARPHSEPERPTLVTEDDVQAVAASETVRRRLAERLRFTINLEDRYRVLTLVVALRSLEDGYRGDYTAKQLLLWASEAWPAGFEELGVKRVEIYLTEMVGLGLLVRLGDRSRFAVRSPNVVNMLGTREELELELSETEFSLPYDYNPRAARRLLGRDPRNQLQRYSPLTEGQLHEAAQPGVTVVGVTALHRPSLILKAASAFAEARGVEVRRCEARDDMRVVLKDASRVRKNYVLLADLRGCGAGELTTAVRNCVEHAGPAADKIVHQEEGRNRTGNRSVLVVADIEAVGALQGTWDGERLPVRFFQPERWTVDALRAWPECPFVSRSERTRLVEATGGWAQWAELAIAEVAVKGATLDSALGYVRRTIDKSVNVDAHLEQSGLGERDLELLGMWNAYLEEGQGVPVDDVEAATGLPTPETEAWLGHLDQLGVLDSVDGGIAVDPVTFRAVRARFVEG